MNRFGTTHPSKVLPVLITGLAFALACPAAAAADDEAGTFMWRVRGDGGATVHLLGSIHYMKEDAYPLPQVVEHAFSSSEIVVFETDIDELGRAAVAMLAAAGLPEDTTLADVLEPELYRNLVERLDGVGLDRSTVDRMAPWMAALTLTSLELQRAGYFGSEGIDAHLAARAAADRKERRALESVEFQISLFTDMKPDEAADFLRYTLTEIETVIPMVDDIVASWKRGDVGQIEQLLVEGFDQHPELYSKIVTDRNRSWLPQIEELLADDVDALVVVGSLHLVGGQGLIALLRGRGYEVEQL
jgi:uncharacterized protein YbaP (TraB family)